MTTSLFITYDGLLDPLGGSQILPYVRGIARDQGGVVILSFEKAYHAHNLIDELAVQLSKQEISWKPLRFTSRLGIIGKAWDLLKMYSWGLLLAKQYRVKVVHARGHPPAQIGLYIKRILGAKLIFDFRGLWVDERVDKGGWNLERRLDRIQYHHYKKVEQRLLAAADQIVVLTKAVVEEVIKLGAGSSTKVTVIPCCADFDHFRLVTPELKAKARLDTGIPDDAMVLGYLGSVGRIYMLDRFFRLLELASAQRDNVHAMLVTRNVEELNKIMNATLPEPLRARVHIHTARRAEVPNLLASMDIMASFVLPSYARISMSPTKLAECFAVGLPVICNPGVGDVAIQMDSLTAGMLVDPTDDDALQAIVGQFDTVRNMGSTRLRNTARLQLGLEVARERYNQVYANLNLES